MQCTKIKKNKRLQTRCRGMQPRLEKILFYNFLLRCKIAFQRSNDSSNGVDVITSYCSALFNEIKADVRLLILLHLVDRMLHNAMQYLVGKILYRCRDAAFIANICNYKPFRRRRFLSIEGLLEA